jgi:hypothetical protein
MSFIWDFFAASKGLRGHKQPQVAYVASKPLIQPFRIFLEPMLHCVVFRLDQEFGTIFKVTPPMIHSFTYGQSFKVVGRVGVAAFNCRQLLRSLRDKMKTSSLVLQHGNYCRLPPIV